MISDLKKTKTIIPTNNLPRSKTIIASTIFLPNKFEEKHMKYKNQKTNGEPENGG